MSASDSASLSMSDIIWRSDSLHAAIRFMETSYPLSLASFAMSRASSNCRL